MAGYLDAIIVPLSLFLMAGYHCYLWHCLKKSPSCTTIGINSHRRRMLFLEIMKVIIKLILLVNLVIYSFACACFLPRFYKTNSDTILDYNRSSFASIMDHTESYVITFEFHTIIEDKTRRLLKS